MKRRISSMFLALVMLLSMLPGTALAAQDAPAALSAEVDSGTCGDDLTWTLDASGTLTISGTGEMTDSYSSPCSDRGWRDEHWRLCIRQLRKFGVCDDPQQRNEHWRMGVL